MPKAIPHGDGLGADEAESTEFVEWGDPHTLTDLPVLTISNVTIRSDFSCDSMQRLPTTAVMRKGNHFPRMEGLFIEAICEWRERRLHGSITERAPGVTARHPQIDVGGRTRFTSMKVNPILDQLGVHGVAAVQQRARDLRAAGERIIDFSIGDPREPTPTMIPDALVASVPEVSQYPTTKGLPELRDAIAGYVGRRFGVEVDPDTQIMPTSGSKEAIFSTPLAFIDRNRNDLVTWATPGYPIYERGARLAGARGNPIRLMGDFVFRPEMVDDQAWDESVILWTCSPHNPAGTVADRDTVRAFVERARGTETWLCADECYVDLYETEAPSSVLEFAGPGSPGVLSFLSLSKRSGMTGYRSGAVVGDSEAISRLAALRVATGTASPEFVQAAAIAAWSDDDHARVRREIFTGKRRVLLQAFESAGLEVIGSSAGLYLWMRVGDDVAVTATLLEHGVVVSPGRAFGPGGEGYIRLALVPTLDECVEAAEAVVRCLR